MTTTQPIPANPQATPPAGLDHQQILTQYITDELLNGRMQVEVDDDLLGGEIIDSLGMMWLVAFIEETFGVSVPLEDITIQNFRTIETIQAYVQRRENHGAG
ncbi:MAG: acyl carrier protein [Cyanobacteria bacterium J06639_16]